MAKHSAAARQQDCAFGEGVLIFEEVKVSLEWSSRTVEFIGHAMISDEMSTLYEAMEKVDKTASYVV